MPAISHLGTTSVFGAIDWIVVLLYMAVVVAIGIWASKGQASKRDFFLGGRQLPWWVVGFSIVATETSALTFIGVPSYAIGGILLSEDGSFSFAGGNMLFMMVTTGYVLGRLIIAIWIVPYFFHGDIYTPNQLLTRAFGKPARMGAATLCLADLSLGQGIRVLVPSIAITLIMQTSFPGWQLWMSIMVAVMVALLYTAIGGIKAVVWTDMVQYFVFVGGGLFALFYATSMVTTADGTTGWPAVVELAGHTMEWWNSGLMSTSAVAAAQEIPVDQVGFFTLLKANFFNLTGGRFNLFMGIVPITVGIVFAFGFNQLNVQRLLGCKSVNDARKALVMSAVLIVPQFLLFLLVGSAVYAYYASVDFTFEHLQPWDPATVDPETGMGTPNTDYVFPIFIVEQIPPVMKGFLVAGILAAAMSSLSSALSAMSSIALMDLFRPMRKTQMTEKQELWASRFVTIAAGIVLALVALLARGDDLLINLAFTVGGLTGGPLLGAFIWALLRRRGHPLEVIAGIAFAFTFMSLLIFVLIPRGYATISWPWYSPMGMLICMGVAWLVSLVTERSTERDITKAEADES
ncbi:MAG: hypothetical protein JJU11_10730 [Candidatus Sumerlaeia bacterium]|nr:hypothetical protein [Candidatus Sumerlaeia bacterium]